VRRGASPPRRRPGDADSDARADRDRVVERRQRVPAGRRRDDKRGGRTGPAIGRAPAALLDGEAPDRESRLAAALAAVAPRHEW
jgi:hypothetical protein